ncbi:ubiquitin-like domain-containing protein [Antribacter gilvus]|uniref:aggregation-promoting factor C-terminal-like domain-containing protein n=1 Tax=Antribacter gilvus TaxID=2304675 RepID=UPI001F0BB868|nr:ubiquitin-like domain-containing protein [Antribacter gilvus]
MDSVTLDRPQGPASQTPKSRRELRAGSRGPQTAALAAATPVRTDLPLSAVEAEPAPERSSSRTRRSEALEAPPEPASRPRPWLETRRARLSVQAVVIASLVAVPALFATQAKTVTIDYDGEVRTVGVYGSSVQEALASQGIEVERADTVQPAPDSVARHDGTIVVRTSREVMIEIDGQPLSVLTTAHTVGELLSVMGPRGEGALATASRSSFLDREPVRVSTLKTVQVAVDGAVLPLHTTKPTVEAVLAEAGITLAEGDATSVPLGAAAVDGMVVLVNRGAHQGQTVTEVLPFGIEEVENSSLPKGYRAVRTRGRAGEAVITYEVKVMGGAVIERSEVSREVTREPVNEVVVVGTMDISTAPVDPGSARAIGKELAAARGWGDDQFACLDKLWQKESGWRWNADNPSSSAYGIPQALPGSKMATAGADWQTNPATQITWGLGYIAGRYGTPCGAWAHSVDVGWY